MMRDGNSLSALILQTLIPVVIATFLVPVASGEPSSPAIEESVIPGLWHYIGPFSAGARERVGPPGEFLVSPDFSKRHRSILASEGWVGWHGAEPDSTGWVSIEFKHIPWDTLMDIYGYAGILNVTYAYCEIESDCRRRALVATRRIGSFYLNGVPFPGNPYRDSFVMVPVILQPGKNSFLLSLGGFGDHRFRFELIPPTASVITLKDFTLPDLIKAESGKFAVGIPVVNTTNQWLHNVILTLGDDDYLARQTVKFNLAPLCVKKIPITIKLRKPAQGVDQLRIPLMISGSDFSFTDTLAIEIKSPGEPHRRTFISRIDSSCQYFAVLPPADFSPEKTYALIYALHGAGVKAENLVRAYKPKDWAYVVAPTNRRPFGFDWEDWGRLDALEVLDLVLDSYPIDPDRVYLTGHSMGGHGTWHIGLLYPDRFAAMAPEAGWIRFDLYIPWFLQKSYVLGEPWQRLPRDMCLTETSPVRYLKNALNLPIFILQGGADDNVPPVHSRSFARELEHLGYDYEYLEIPGRPHWWRIESLDVTCVDHPRLLEFLKQHRRNPAPATICFSTSNISTARKCYWVEILLQEVPFTESSISATLKQNEIEIRTKNVRAFRIAPPKELLPHETVKLVVDGKEWLMSLKDTSRLVFSKVCNRFKLCPAFRKELSKRPGLYGPIKQAYFSPFVLVYGTMGDSVCTNLLLHNARTQAITWWLRGNGYTEILPDTSVTDEIIQQYNLIILGSSNENQLTSALERRLPIKRTEDGFKVGRRKFTGQGLSAVFVYPNPLAPKNLVLIYEGVDLEGLKNSSYFASLYSGAGLPDFIVFDSDVWSRGWAGVRCAGFFNSDWKLDDRLTFPHR